MTFLMNKTSVTGNFCKIKKVTGNFNFSLETTKSWLCLAFLNSNKIFLNNNENKHIINTI